MLYVYDKAMPSTKNEYVCWIDIMGTKTVMKVSVKTSSIFIFKLHTAVLDVIRNNNNVRAYPIMDGVYLTSKTQDALLKALFYINSKLATLFKQEKDFLKKFLIRSSVAFGPVIHGSDIQDSINDEFKNEETKYKDKLLMGLPMIQAYEGEKYAPPFGVFIHESARAFAPTNEEPIKFKWWKWVGYGQKKWEDKDIKEFSCSLDEYFRECTRHSQDIDYPENKIKEHQELVREYFDHLVIENKKICPCKNFSCQPVVEKTSRNKFKMG